MQARLAPIPVVLPLLLVMILACGPASDPSPGVTPSPPASPAATEAPAGAITVYSGRSEQLVAPLIERFQADTGITVNVRYADTAELAVLLTEEGANSPADVYFAQDAGALGAVAQAGLLSELPPATLDRVAAPFRSPAGQWVGISGRARVIAYDSREVAEHELPQSIDELTADRWRGRIGWAPTNGSFQAFVTGLRLVRGDAGARDWLMAMLENEPVRYEGNTPIVQAIADGEVELGLVNHYYALRQRAEQGEDFPVRNHFLPGDDPAALINIAGAGMLSSSDNPAAALAFIGYLLSPDAQRYFAEQTFEYPLLAGVEQPAGTPPLAELASPDIDLSDLSDLDGTLRMLNDVGVLP